MSLLYGLRDNLVNWLNDCLLLNIVRLLGSLDYGLNKLGILLSDLNILGLLCRVYSGLHYLCHLLGTLLSYLYILSMLRYLWTVLLGNLDGLGGLNVDNLPFLNRTLLLD